MDSVQEIRKYINDFKTVKASLLSEERQGEITNFKGNVI